MEAGSRHEVLAGVETLAGDLDALAAAMDRAWALTDRQARDAVEGLVRLQARLAAVTLAAVRELDGRPEAVAGAATGRVAVTFLSHRVRMDPATAGTLVRAAQALDPDSGPLPQVAAALAAGEVTPEHAQVCVRAVAALPKRLLAVQIQAEDGVVRTGAEVVDGWLVQQCRTQRVGTAALLARQLVERLDPDRRERFDPDAHLRRDLTLGADGLGMGLLRGTLTPADAAVLRAFLSAAARPTPANEALVADADGTVQTVLVRDERTVGMRRYDALMGLVRSAVRGDGPVDAGVGAPSPEVRLLVTATVEQVAAAGGHEVAPAGPAQLSRTGPIPTPLLAFLSCNATIQRVLSSPSGQPLDVGRAHRFATPTQRLALAVRDGGCVIPGCTCPPEGCDVHHLTAWASGGATDLNNQVMLCPAHHQQVHAGTWTVQIRDDGLPWVKPPPWIDSAQRWTRNLYAHTAAEARRLGVQLRLALDAGDG